MVINTNVSSITAQEAAKNTSKNISSSLEKLSTGLKINKASDDASGLAIADKLRTQVTGTNQAIDNGNSAVALLQIADKSMSEQSNILDTVKAKLIQANTATTSTAGKTAIANDINKLITQLDNIADQTNYNGINVLKTAALSFQVGDKSTSTISLSAVTSNSTKFSISGLKTITAAGLTAGLQTTVDTALTTLNGLRSGVGSTQNQVESAVRNLMTQSTNLSAAESVIRDVDYAQESANFNKQNIISQAGSYAISQANATQQNVLRLLQ
ncbi:MAG: flagellin [Arcobacter sp.]|nr:MAG: flagellin [Arcobacter sp.]